MIRPATRRVRRLAAAAGVLPLLLLAGCVVSTTDNGVTFLAESNALCAPTDDADAVVGVGIEVHGSRGGTLGAVTASHDGKPVAIDAWLLDAFPANQSTTYPATSVAGWDGRQDPDGASVSPGSHTIVVRIRQSQTGTGTTIDKLSIPYTVDGSKGTAVSTGGIGFGTANDHACE